MLCTLTAEEALDCPGGLCSVDLRGNLSVYRLVLWLVLAVWLVI
jgi:hypothetical protein